MICLCEEGQQEILAVFTVVVELGGNRGTETEQDLCGLASRKGTGFRDSALQRDMSLLFLRVAGWAVDKCISIKDGHLSNQPSELLVRP